MNIVVLSVVGNVMVRPDTTWEKDGEDLYVPEFIQSLKYSPVLFARISKPGRSISKKFASRYYDAIGYGILLYPTDLLEIPEQGWACASCMDHTSFLPYPLYSPITLGNPINEFTIKKNSKTIYKRQTDSTEIIEKAIEQVSSICYLRIGDIVAIEFEKPMLICSKEDNISKIDTYYCDNQTLDFKIIF